MHQYINTTTMKTMFKSALICLAATTALLFSSCEDKVTTDEEELDYADFTIEETKQNLQNEGMAIMEKMEGMKNMSFVSTVQDLAGLIMYGSLKEEQNPMMSLLAPLAKADKNIMSLSSLRASDKSMESLSRLFANRGGIYSYDFEADTFAYVPDTTQIVYNFPVGESTENNGKLTISNYAYQLSTTMEKVIEMPKSLSINISRNDTTLLAFAMTATYYDNDMPKNENTTFSFKEGYTFQQTGNYDPQKLSWNFSYSYENQPFLSGKYDLEGTLDYDSIKSDKSMEELADSYLTKMSSTIQFGNIKSVGVVNYADLVAELDAYELSDNMSEDTVTYNAYIKDMCAIMNKHIKAHLQYADTQKAIAKFMFYKQSGSHIRYSKRPDLESKIVFADGSAMDKTFFATGFENINTEGEALFTDLLASYGIFIEVIGPKGDDDEIDDDWSDDDWSDDNWSDDSWSSFIKKLF